MDLKLSRLDYFTLQVLVGLYELKNGTCLAVKLDVAQPKVSRALSTIREVFNDEMFVRKQYGFEPNELAIRIYPFAKKVIDGYQQIQLAAQNNCEQKRIVNIATLDYNTNLLHRSVVAVSKKLALNTVVNIIPWSDEIQKQITSGKVDYSITINPVENDKIMSAKIADVKKFYIVARKGHPIFEKTFGYSDLISNSFVLINYARVGLKKRAIEHYVEKHGGTMDIVLKTNSLNNALSFVSSNDCICISATETVLEHVVGRDDLQYQDTSEFWATHVMADLAPAVRQHSQYLQGRVEGDIVFFNELVLAMRDGLVKLQKCLSAINQQDSLSSIEEHH
ncbi:LysR family transcriptional regulator [Shewanella sp. KX20019]|uniref:LysR family transcriptional regulator n=1 Tax=Shewanella sp. KX20019 TaxID=2803864 RepID=UPI0019264E15|nr:LysR family transcriptional regulator [Shewanella sp. KX20019]QQX80781.1 LysR family transcriptional regulator [Shewanella sp. KX20019]